MVKEKSYSMKETMQIGDEGMAIVRNFLETHPSHVNFLNVEKDEAYQKVDIDFFWSYMSDGQVSQSSCELKTDRYTTQNFFFETDSNLEKGTPGCFMYTEAKFLFYYFINKGDLYVMHTDTVRNWFVENKERFQEKFLNTKSDKNDKTYYRSAGRLVPIPTLLNECGSVVYHFKLPRHTPATSYINLNQNHWKQKQASMSA